MTSNVTTVKMNLQDIYDTEGVLGKNPDKWILVPANFNCNWLKISTCNYNTAKIYKNSGWSVHARMFVDEECICCYNHLTCMSTVNYLSNCY